jgi:hypothetical protein
VGHLVRGQGAAAKRKLIRHLLEAHARLAGNGARNHRATIRSLPR